MSQVSNKTAISFQIAGIQTLEFAIIKESFKEGAPVEFGMNAGFAVKSLDICEIACVPEVSFVQDGNPFLKIKISMLFRVEPTAWNKHIDKDHPKIEFPKAFADHLLVLSLGTVRGVLHAKTEGTPFNRFFVPTINVAEILTTDTIILKP